MYTLLRQFGHVKVNEPLNKHTTFKIGGPADYLVTVDDTEKLVELLKFLDGEGTPYFVLGGGSNMLVRDEGFQGVVINIKTQKTLVKDQVVEADAGCSTVAIAQLSMQHGLTGFEWGVGVPGTIGGAVRGNAGAMGGEMKNNVEKVEVYKDGEIIELSNEECRFGYRDSVFKHESGIVLRVWLSLAKGENKDGMKTAIEYLQYRNKTQPQGYASTGCIFKNVDLETIIQGLKSTFVISNAESSRSEKSLLQLQTKLFSQFPEDDEKIAKFFSIGKISAGWLVEKAGMKGAQVGQAKVSETHGNFVVNLGGATATDVLTLVEQIKEKVYTTCGIHIEEEIQII